jgi:nucleoside phosphorylase
MRLAIFCALRWECRPVLQALRQVERRQIDRWKVWTATHGDGEIVVVQTGVGMERAAAAARAVAVSDHFNLFMSAGCAGALDAALRAGDLVVAHSIVADDMRFDSDAAFEAQATEVCARLNLPFRVGAVLTSPIVLTNAAARQKAVEASGAIAVEMEAAAIAQIAYEHGVGIGEVRAVLDSADMELHESGDFIDPESGRLRPLDVVRFVASHPSAASQLWALRRMMGAAERSLRRFFATYLAQ